MDSKSTLVGKCILLLKIITFFISFTALANPITLQYISFQKNVVAYRFFEVYSINSNANNLFWITENESNNDHFEIERSFDQKNFRTIGLIFGEENNTTGSYTYNYNDQSPELRGHKVIYYRLKQIEASGKFQYSDLKEVRFNANSKVFMEVLPDSNMEKVNVNFISKENGKGEVRLKNAKGQVIITKQSSIIKGYNAAELTNLTSQIPGLYTVEIVVGDRIINTSTVVKK